MTAIIVSYVTSISLPSSNIPLVLSLSKLALFINQFPFTLTCTREKFVLTNSKKYQRLWSTLGVLLHWSVALKWVLNQWIYPSNPPSPIWKFVLMYYFIILLAADVAFVIHLSLLKDETIFLLNSSIQLEQAFKGQIIKNTLVIHYGK